MKSLFEQNGGTYTKVGDYYIPNLTVPECKPIDKYGMLCGTYLKNYCKAFYNTLFVSGILNDYLCDIDRQANELKDNLLPKYKDMYGVSEQLKSENQMKWVQLMNTIAHQIDEIILDKLIYTP
ncbi:MAG: TnpV protein [Clostridia bacterium]|nr:TnpV protein [Clostridia bacterium]